MLSISKNNLYYSKFKDNFSTYNNSRKKKIQICYFSIIFL